MLRAEGIEAERARELGANIGAVIGTLEGGAAGIMVRRLLGGVVRDATVERLAEMAQRGAFRQAGRGAGQGAALETLSEGAGGAARQTVVAQETGNPDIERRAGEVLFEAGTGGLGGAMVGAAGGAREPGLARQQLQQAGLGPDGQPIPPAPPEAPAPPPPQTFAPQPITTEEAAREYLFGQSNDPDTLRERMRVQPELQGLTGQALIAEANAAQEADYRRNLQTISRQTVDDLLDVTFNPQTREANAPTLDQLVGAVNTYNNSVPAENIDQLISLSGRITPEQIARAALQAAGQQDVDTPTVNAAAGRARQLLNAMVREGTLVANKTTSKNKQGKTTEKISHYTLPTVDAEARAQRIERGQQFATGPQPAPPTAEQAAATDTLSLLTNAAALSREQLTARLAAVESRDPAIGRLARAVVGNQLNNTPESQQELLDAINARLPEERQFELREDDPNPARSLRMLAISELEARAGQQPATAILSPARQSEMRDTTRPDTRVWNPQESPEVIAAALGAASEKTQAAREQMRLVGLSQKGNSLPHRLLRVKKIVRQ
jgi:hypothetical protein